MPLPANNPGPSAEPSLIAGSVLPIQRAEELLAGGSLYWVINGQIAARQRLVKLKPVTREGVPHCALVLDRKIIATVPRKHRPPPIVIWMRYVTFLLVDGGSRGLPPAG